MRHRKTTIAWLVLCSAVATAWGIDYHRQASRIAELTRQRAHVIEEQRLDWLAQRLQQVVVGSDYWVQFKEHVSPAEWEELMKRIDSR